MGAIGAPHTSQLGVPGSGSCRAALSSAAPHLGHHCVLGPGVWFDGGLVDISGPHSAKRFRNESQLEISVKRPITSSTPSAISSPPEATSRACICERKRL